MPLGCSMAAMDKRPAAKQPQTEVGIPMPQSQSALQPNVVEEPALEPGDALEPTVSAQPAAAKAGTKSALRGRATGSRAGATGSNKGSAPPSRKSGRSPSSSSLKATSASLKSAASSRRVVVLTPEEKAARNKVIIWSTVGVLITALVVVGIIMFAGKTDTTRPGTDALAEATRQLAQTKTAMANNKGADARLAAKAALDALTNEPSLGGAIAAPSQEPPVIPDLARRAYDLRQEIEAQNDRIKALEEENIAEANLVVLKARLSKLAEATTDIEQLDKDLQAFIDNPISPKSPAAPGIAERFLRPINEAKLQQPSLVSERQRRKDLRTTVPVRQAQVDTEPLVAEEKYGAALDKLAALAKENTEADFQPIVALVKDASANGWRSAKSQIETRIADWKSPASTEEQRTVALAAAKKRIDEVIERFGIPEYVDQARTMRAALP